MPNVAGERHDEDRRLAPALAVDLAALGQNHATNSEPDAPRASSEEHLAFSLPVPDLANLREGVVGGVGPGFDVARYFCCP